jgi:hypothetical protein
MVEQYGYRKVTISARSDVPDGDRLDCITPIVSNHLYEKAPLCYNALKNSGETQGSIHKSMGDHSAITKSFTVILAPTTNCQFFEIL